MKISPLFLRSLFILLGSLMAFCPGLRGDVIYDNGAPRYVPRTDGFEMTGYLDADDFTLDTSARLESIQFGTMESGGFFQGSVVWMIYSNNSANKPGTLLYSGFASVNHLPTGYVAGPEVEYFSSFAIDPLVLPPGTYWLALHNGPFSLSTNQRVYWQLAATNGPRASREVDGPAFSGGWASNSFPEGTPAELVFRLNGVLAPSITAVTYTGGPVIRFTTSLGRFYRVEYRNNLTDSWSTLSGATLVPGTGNVVPVTDPDPNIAHVPHRYYRVILL